MIGHTLAHYRITAAIGAGGMGEVYRATDTKLGRDVALKVLPAEMAASPERLERFRREAKALAALDHPGIVTVHSVEEAEGVHFLTMQLVEGQPLDKLIPAEGMPVDRLVTIGTALAEALAAAHDKGVVHRDLKPANVVVGGSGSVKVLDFGLAKMSAAGDSGNSALPTEAQTRDGVVMGTVPYMSPEQVSGRPVDHRTDVFSLGVVLYEMASGRRPFQGQSTAELASAILRDSPPVVTELRPELAPEFGRLIRRCLEKDPRQRLQTARDVGNELRDLGSATSAASRSAARVNSAASRREEGFWVAVLPFKHRGTDPGVEALAEGLTEDIVTGLSRFSYLRVIARGSTALYSGDGLDVRSVGQELGARYVMEGSVRQAGSTLRVAVQLVDASSGAHLWAETYNRAFDPHAVFELQDDLVPRVVSTVADWYGILPRSMSEAVRSKPVDQLSPYEALLRAFGYYARVTPQEHAAARPILERAVEEAPGHAAWAMLSMLYGEEDRFGFNALPDPLGRSLQAARRAVEAAPESHVSHLALAQAHYFRKELDAFRSAAERALALNPLDGATVEYLAHLLAFAGDWERGCELGERARLLNPHHPAWYWALPFLDAYRRGDYQRARALAPKALMPGQYYSHALFAAVYGQLGEREAASEHVRELLGLRPDFAAIARDQFGKWYLPQLVEQLIDGLRKAGLAIAPGGGRDDRGPSDDGPSGTPARDSAAVAIAVLPFSDMSPTKDQEYLCEGMAEEIMNALVRVEGMRVASRASTFRARQGGGDLKAIARALSVGHVLEGSVRSAGTRLRVTAQLTDVASGYQLWSERFDREAADVFAVQDEIASGVVAAVKARLAPGARPPRLRPQAPNLEAYRAYLRGRHLRGKEDHAGALQAFGEAIRLDPSHAPSWTGLAEITVLSSVFSMLLPREACRTARQALEKAASLQGESADGWHVEGFACWIERRWEAMEVAWRRALELEPTHVLALGSFAISLCTLQRLEEALPFFERAREADPLASFPYTLTGGGYLTCGRRHEAVRHLEDALAFEKEDVTALYFMSVAKVALENGEEGIALAERAVTVSHRGGVLVGILGWALATTGRTAEARALLGELQARPAGSPTVVSEAWLLGALGEIDAAFEVLERAEEECQANLYFTGLPVFDPLRDDPRFTALLQRLGLPPEGRS